MDKFNLFELANRTPATADEADETMAACMILEAFAEHAELEWIECHWILYAIGAEGDERPFFVGITTDLVRTFRDHLTVASSPETRASSPVAVRIDAEMPKGVWCELLQWGMTLGQANHDMSRLIEQLYRQGIPVLRLGEPNRWWA